MTSAPAAFHSGFVALLGRPNVGKSTLVNHLVGSKVSIVSDHPQTTRRRISGVVTGDHHQLVLLDLPGFQKPFDSLTKRMQATVDTALSEVDAAILVFNAAEELGAGDRFIADAAVASGIGFVSVLNKIDVVSADLVAKRQASACALVDGADVLAVSARRGDGVADAVAALIPLLPEGPRYFPDDATSDQPLELLVAELVREQALRVTREEVPHAIAVKVEEIREQPGRGLVEIEADVFVEHESQKPILVGKGGRTIKQIGSEARREIEAVLGTRVYLGLRVKVRRRWRRDDASVDRFL